jgi:hypothetical protein
MPEKFTSLNKTFNTPPSVTEEVTSVIPDVVDPPKKIDETVAKEIESDYKYTRKNLYAIIERGQDALECALEAAMESSSPRNYEVVSQLIKSVSDASDKLMELQKNMADLRRDKDLIPGPSTVNNSVFLGSTTELAKFLRDLNGGNQKIEKKKVEKKEEE